MALLAVAPLSRIDIHGMAPHAFPGRFRLLLDALVSGSVAGDCVSFAYEPCADVLTVARHGANGASELVVFLDVDHDVLPTDLPDQCVLYVSAVPEPVAICVFCQLIPLGCVQVGEPDLLPAHSDPVAVGDEGLPG